MDVSKLIQFLEQHVIQTIVVGYSGGLDSSVLLHLCATSPEIANKYAIQAIYVNHHLSPHADAWQNLCEKNCKALAIPFQVQHLNISKERGQSLEALAREMRYQVLAEQVDPHTCLLTGHHLDDQAETFLLQLMRGSGVKGLSAMSFGDVFERGFHCRPLLDYSKEQLLAYAKEQQLTWIEDESNSNENFDRNFIRHQILQNLKARWPSAAETIARSARHCAHANNILEKHTKPLLQKCMKQNNSLDCENLQAYLEEEQALIIREWLLALNLPLPSQAILKQIQGTGLYSQYDKSPLIRFNGIEVRRFRKELYAFPSLTEIPQGWSTVWQADQDLELPGNLGYLPAKKFKDYATSEGLQVCFRQEGMRVRLKEQGPHYKLKHLFQDWDVPPWLRDRLPLVFKGELLICAWGYYWNKFI